MQGDGNSPQGNASAKVHRTVYRVDNPTEIRIGAFYHAHFFGSDRMARERLADSFYNKLLAAYIGNGHHVFNGLVLHIAQFALQAQA